MYLFYLFFLLNALVLLGQDTHSKAVLPQAAVPDSLHPYVTPWLQTIFGDTLPSPFIVIAVQPNFCPRCEAYFPYIADLVTSIDSSLSKHTVLIFHSISSHSTQQLAKHYPYKNFSHIFYDSTGIIRKIVPLGLPYCLIFDNTGKILFQTPLFGKINTEQLSTTLKEALAKRQPLKVSDQQRRQFETFYFSHRSSTQPRSQNDCFIPLSSSNHFARQRSQVLVLPSAYSTEENIPIKISFSTHTLITLNFLTNTFTAFSFTADSLSSLHRNSAYTLPRSILTRFVTLDTQNLKSVERQGLLRPIFSSEFDIDDTTFMQFVYLPSISYEATYDSATHQYDTTIAARTTLCGLVFKIREGKLHLDTLESYEVMTDLAFSYVENLLEVGVTSSNQRYVLLQITRGIPYKTYFIKNENILNDQFYDSAYAFALYFPTTQEFQILPILLPSLYRKLKIGYGVSIGPIGALLSPTTCAALYPLSPYLWLYDLQKNTVDTVFLKRGHYIADRYQQLYDFLHPLQQNIQDTMLYIAQYRSLLDTLVSMMSLIPVKIAKLTDSTVAIKLLKLAPSSTWDNLKIEQTIYEFYNISQKTFLTDLIIEESQRPDNCRYLLLFNHSGSAWNSLDLLYYHANSIWIDKISIFLGQSRKY